MPHAAPKLCTMPGCSALVSGGRCKAHEYDRGVKTEKYIRSHKLYKSARWQRAREYFLKHNPLCVYCLADDITSPATVVDHIKPHDGTSRTFFDQSNWQPLCKRCHDSKTARQDGGFGNKKLEV